MTTRWKAAALGGLVVAGAAAIAGSAPRAGGAVTVRALSAKLMKQPRFIGPVVGDVARGDQLGVESTQGAWVRVTGAAAGAGWLHQSALVDGRIKLQSTVGASTKSASREEVELAGRGFTPEVEAEYRRKHGDLDFTHVDAIEKEPPDPAGVGLFAAAGKLGGGR